MHVKKEAPAVSFVIDNSFAWRMSRRIFESRAANVTLGDIFKIALELPNVKAALMPNYIYAWELQGKVFDPETNEYRPILYQAEREESKQSADFFRTHAQWCESHDQAQTMLHEDDLTKIQTKLLVVQGPYDRTEGVNLSSTVKRETRIHGPRATNLIKALHDEKFYKGSKGEKAIVSLVENTKTNSHVFLLSDDLREFADEHSPFNVHKLKSADGNNVSLCTSKDFFEKLLSSKTAREYVTQRLKETKRLPKDFTLDSHKILEVTAGYTGREPGISLQKLSYARKHNTIEVLDLESQFEMAANAMPYLPASPSQLGTGRFARPQHFHGSSGGYGI